MNTTIRPAAQPTWLRGGREAHALQGVQSDRRVTRVALGQGGVTSRTLRTSRACLPASYAHTLNIDSGFQVPRCYPSKEALHAGPWRDRPQPFQCNRYKAGS